MPDVLDEVAKLAEARGYRVEKSGTTLTIHHPYLEPLSIRVSLEDERLALELGLGEIRDYIDDLVEEKGEEEARGLVEEALDDIGELSAQIEAIARRHGLRVDNRVRSGILDVLEALEDVLES